MTEDALGLWPVRATSEALAEMVPRERRSCHARFTAGLGGPLYGEWDQREYTKLRSEKGRWRTAEVIGAVLCFCSGHIEDPWGNKAGLHGALNLS